MKVHIAKERWAGPGLEGHKLPDPGKGCPARRLYRGSSQGRPSPKPGSRSHKPGSLSPKHGNPKPGSPKLGSHNKGAGAVLNRRPIAAGAQPPEPRPAPKSPKAALTR